MFRNKEVKQFAWVYLSLTIVLAATGFFISPVAGILALASSLIFGVTFITFTRARYRSLARISKQIDLVLHNAERLEFEKLDEGELSLLQSEIAKMTLRIREQNETLKKDRQYLADSLADIAHQLRTPLTSANLILSFLAKDQDQEKHQAFVSELEGLFIQIDWLITSLLKISRVDAGVVQFKQEQIQVQRLVQSALRPLAILLELRAIDTKIDVPKDALIQGDAEWLGEAVQNILKNCMESVGENGSIEIICSENVLYTELTICDSGGGFSKEDLPHVFDRFYRGKSTSAAGYGIGLALSKMILTRQGALITARNHPQGGALFVIHFPKNLEL